MSRVTRGAELQHFRHVPESEKGASSQKNNSAYFLLLGASVLHQSQQEGRLPLEVTNIKMWCIRLIVKLKDSNSDANFPGGNSKLD